jgi:CHAT domain
MNDMDIAVLTTLLSPCLPFLMKWGEKAAESASSKISTDAWETAKKIWEKLHPKLEAKDDARVAAEQVAANPESKGHKLVFQEELEKLLKENPDLAKAIAQILQEEAPDRTSGTQIVQTVTGNQNQVIGQMAGGQAFGNITGTVVIGQSASPVATTPAPAVDSTTKDAPPSVKTILVLAANPKGTTPLRLGEEVRNIQMGLARSQYRDRFRIEQRWAVTPTDVRRALLDCQPQIVHFSGHGIGVEAPGDRSETTRNLNVVAEATTEPEGLMFEGTNGQPQLVSSEAIANLFALFADQVECVVLNACYSATQADAIAQHIPYVVGMKRAIGDRAAIEFAIGFYDALLAGRSVEFAYKLGCSAIQMEGIPEHLTPALKQKLK